MTLRCTGIAVELAQRCVSQEMHTNDRTSEVTGLQARRGRINDSKRIRINRLQAQTVLDTDYVSVVLYGGGYDEDWVLFHTCFRLGARTSTPAHHSQKAIERVPSPTFKAMTWLV